MTAEPPVVSVVSGVFNAGRYLLRSAESVRTQDGVSWEWVVVDDGSTDGSSRLLAELAAADPRVRVVWQENQGLTKALVHGCELAQGRYIARHDADDLSLPGRLARQVELLRADPGSSMASCWSLAVGPEDEELYSVVRPADSALATEALRRGEEGPCHGSVVFRAEAYRRVGGYRAEFRYAQDWDLWLRLTEVGRIAYVPDFLYCYRVGENNISAHRRGQQLRLQQAAQACVRARAGGQPERPHLEEAAHISAEPASSFGNGRAGNSYFIGKCLLDRRDRRALPYLKRGVRQDPWSWRRWAALAGAALLCRSRRHPS
jgi:glycosyltransferase involved in cell wall biosynthesis